MKATKEDYKLLAILIGGLFIAHIVIDLWYLVASNG